jgi:hypothetical protein
MVWDHIAGLTPPPFIEIHVPRQESERSCICVLDVPIFFSFYDFDCICLINNGTDQNLRQQVRFIVFT